MIEGLFAADLAYLQELYNEINRVDERSVVHLPAVPAHVRAGASLAGGS